MENAHSEALKTIISTILEKMGFEASVEITTQEGLRESFFCAVTVKEGQNFLIGQYGVNLAALQHIVRVMARKMTGEAVEIVVDVNNYFFEKKVLLEKEAQAALAEVLQNNVSVVLRPMLPYERKIIHSFFATHSSVMTESAGQGADRKVMVHPRVAAAQPDEEEAL